MEVLVSNLKYLSERKSSIPHRVWSQDAILLHDSIKNHREETFIRPILTRLNRVFSDHNLPTVDLDNLNAECTSFAIHNGLRRY